jgi:hypothetical protein
MNKQVSAICFAVAAVLFAVSLKLFINSLSIINHFRPVTGPIHFSPAFYFGLAGANTLVLFGSGMLIGVGFLAMLLFGYSIASRESEGDLLSSTVSRY